MMERRAELIREIESIRSSRVLTYFVSDRPGPGASAMIADDAVRPMYDHLLAMDGSMEPIDLFLYSTGGATEVPWRIVSMVREFSDRFAVLVPYKAMSAATMIALGADEIVMGRKGELGPIDTQMTIARPNGTETVRHENIAVEDVMAYLRLVDEVGVKNEDAIARVLVSLTEHIDPKLLGQIHRAHSHTRDVARKLLLSRHPENSIDDTRVQQVIDTLAEQTYQHGHAVGRKEASEIGLNIIKPDTHLESLMWELLIEYEALCNSRVKFDPVRLIRHGQDSHSEIIVMACIESAQRADQFRSEIHVQHKRQSVPQLSLQLNIDLKIPDSIEPGAVRDEVTAVGTKVIDDLKQTAPTAIQQAIAAQMPIIGTEVQNVASGWNQLAEWPS